MSAIEVLLLQMKEGVALDSERYNHKIPEKICLLFTHLPS